MPSRPYSPEEVLSFDRIKRAMTTRILDSALPAFEQGKPLGREELAELVTQEWSAVVEAVRKSPAGAERAREHIEKVVSEMIDNMINSGKEELEALGVQDKYL